jgi:enoyl-[acyl-carrier protein] reductase III
VLKPLRDSWCLILGASSGMGAACAEAMAQQGAHIFGVHFDTAAAESSVDELLTRLRSYGVQAHFENANAASKATRGRLLPRIAELTGGQGIRVFMHSLAFGSLVPFLPRGEWTNGLTQRQLEMTVDVMAHSLVYWTQDLVEAGLLSRGAKVYAMTSSGSARSLPSYGAVSAAKSALESHVRQLACELAVHGIAVNAVRAGTTITPALRRIPEHTTFVARAKEINPHGRLTEPRDVAEAVVLLSQTDSSWITGNTLGVDGAEHIAAGASWESLPVNGKARSDLP